MSSTQLLLIAVFITAMILMSLNYGKRKRKVLFITNENMPELVTRNFIEALQQNIIRDGVEHRFAINTMAVITSLHQLLERVEIIAAHKTNDVIILCLFPSPPTLLGDETIKSETLMDEALNKCVAQNIEVIIYLSAFQSEQRQADYTSLYEVIIALSSKHHIPLIDGSLFYQDNNEIASKKIWKLLSMNK